MAVMDDSQENDDGKQVYVARVSVFSVIAYATLLADAYLVLASLASRVMKVGYASNLLPFYADKSSDGSLLVVLVITTWTAVLALGCLSWRRGSSGESVSVVGIWVCLVLAVPWLFVLKSVVGGALHWAKQLFLYGA